MLLFTSAFKASSSSSGDLDVTAFLDLVTTHKLMAFYDFVTDWTEMAVFEA